MNDKKPKPITCEIDLRMRMITLIISDAIDKAHARKGTSNYVGGSYDGRYYPGVLGEQVFLEVLRKRGIKFIYDVKDDGNADSGDFVVFINGKKLIIDVKVSKYTYSKSMNVFKDTFDKYVYEVYVSAKLDDYIGYGAKVMGYAKRKMFKEQRDGFDKRHIPTMYVKYSELIDIEKLLNILDKGEPEINYSENLLKEFKKRRLDY